MSKGGFMLAILEGIAGVIGYVAGELFKNGVFKAAGVEDEDAFVAKIDQHEATKSTKQIEDKEAKHEAKHQSNSKGVR